MKSDTWITQAALLGMITPFEANLVRTVHHQPCISFGMGSYSYDVRLQHTLQLMTADHGIIDPKNFNAQSFTILDVPILPPHSFALACTVETFIIPNDVVVLCVGKSTYARCGLVVNPTILQPGWQGIITLELSNTSPLPIRVYPEEGIAQLLFFESKEPCHRNYDMLQGVYQHQEGVTLPLI
jgi:dCTP deaminase